MDSLRSAWTARDLALTRERYDPYADVLYACLLEALMSSKEDIIERLRATIETARSRKDLEVPVWSYVAGYSKTPEAPLLESRIGTGPMGLPPVPVYKVLHLTDVLHRLAWDVYGPDAYLYDRYKETLTETDQGCLTRRELVLAFYPYGLPTNLSTRIQSALTRRAERAPYRMTFVERATYVDPTMTPPQTPPSSPPRMIPRRR
jgi:hypothetical protein